jgi:allantoate deiminase
VEVLALAEEEGSRFPYVFWGSKNIVGIANPADVREIKDAKGVAFVDAMKQCGFSLPAAPLAPRRDIKAFVELHIEQGRVLETNKQSIGVVNAIVGQRRYTITLNGESNHAGTTPMGYRRDTVHALAASAANLSPKRKPTATRWCSPSVKSTRSRIPSTWCRVKRSLPWTAATPMPLS